VAEEIFFPGDATDLVNMIITEPDSKCRYWMLRVRLSLTIFELSCLRQYQLLVQALLNLPADTESDTNISLDDFKMLSAHLLVDASAFEKSPFFLGR
jgi:hypothetical protein